MRKHLLIAIEILLLGICSACARPAILPQIGTEKEFLIIEEIVIALLMVATFVGIAARSMRVPYTVGLVLMGLVLALVPQFEVQIQPELILGLLVPPLIFEAAFYLDFTDLRRNLAPIATLAIPGVILTVVLVGGMIAWGTGIALPTAFVFGALVAATDPVTVIALYSKIGVPKRLQVLLEGESLFNDGTAIVVFGLVITVALGETFNLVSGVIQFLVVAGGGLLVGIILGTLISQIIRMIDDYLIETTLTSLLAFGSYLIAEALGVSGVLAVVAAGLINGNVGPKGMSPTTRIVVFNFWEYAAFLANSFAFLLIGLQINLPDLMSEWQLIAIAILAVLVARLLTVYGLTWIWREIPLKWQHVLYWGGLRGAISLALALSLPLELGPTRNLLQGMTFGVVLFTLLVQGISSEPLVRRLGLIERSSAQDEYERRHGRAVAAQSSFHHLDRLRRKGLISEHTWQVLSPVLRSHSEVLVEAVREIITSDPSVEAEEFDTARREALRAQRSSLNALYKAGIISVNIYAQLVAEVDTALSDPSIGWFRLSRQEDNHMSEINRLVMAVIQDQDFENAVSSLTKLGFSVTRMPSVGGFLGRRNVTLLIGLSKGQEETVVGTLSKNCRQRVEYISAPLEGTPLPLPAPMPITVGGATIFVMDIEKYEEI